MLFLQLDKLKPIAAFSFSSQKTFSVSSGFIGSGFFLDCLCVLLMFMIWSRSQMASPALAIYISNTGLIMRLSNTALTIHICNTALTTHFNKTAATFLCIFMPFHAFPSTGTGPLWLPDIWLVGMLVINGVASSSSLPVRSHGSWPLQSHEWGPYRIPDSNPLQVQTVIVYTISACVLMLA